MTDFCKIFQSEKYGQILVVNDTNDDYKPSIQVKFNCMADYGVCSVDLIFEDNEDGYIKADKAFETMTEQHAIDAVKNVVDKMLGGS